MIKMIACIKRKPGLSRDAFRQYYEQHHVPLIQRHLKPYMLHYQRNYVMADDPLVLAGAAPDDPAQLARYDVITEIILKDRATLELMAGVSSEPSIAAEIAADEERFCDRGAVRIYITEAGPPDRA